MEYVETQQSIKVIEVLQGFLLRRLAGCWHCIIYTTVGNVLYSDCRNCFLYTTQQLDGCWHCILYSVEVYKCIIYTVFAVSVILYIISQYSDGCKADIGHSPVIECNIVY